MTRPEATPLVDRLWHSESQPRPLDWMERSEAPCAPLVESLVQEIERPDPLDDPEVQARLETARSNAEREARDAGTAEVEALREKLAASINSIDEARARSLDMLAAEIVELALVVATGLCRRELSVEREQLVELVERGIASVSDDGEVRVRLHPTDLEAVAALADGEVELTADDGLEPGDCVIETHQRVIDARVEARVDAVRADLVELLSC